MKASKVPLDHETTRQQLRVLALTEADLPELLDGARQRKNAHIGQLMRLYGGRLEEQLRKQSELTHADIASVVADTFMSLPRLLESYEERGKFEGFLYTSAEFVAQTKRRSERRHHGRFGEADRDPIRLPSANVKLEEAELLGAITARLSASLRAVWTHHVEGRSAEEIGVLLGLRTGAVYTRLHRARKQVLQQVGVETLVEWLGSARLIELVGEEAIVELFGEATLRGLKSR